PYTTLFRSGVAEAVEDVLAAGEAGEERQSDLAAVDRPHPVVRDGDVAKRGVERAQALRHGVRTWGRPVERGADLPPERELAAAAAEDDPSVERVAVVVD